ncbi:hypothetical protein NDU88_001443, partial [Pleurodeles waltl]
CLLFQVETSGLAHLALQVQPVTIDNFQIDGDFAVLFNWISTKFSSTEAGQDHSSCLRTSR